jgi:hypothetical protein
VIEKILRHLDLPDDPPTPVPARQPAWFSGFLPGFDATADTYHRVGGLSRRLAFGNQGGHGPRPRYLNGRRAGGGVFAGL